MKSLCLIILFSFFYDSPISFSQPLQVKNDSVINKNSLDSIKQLLAGTPADTIKVMRLIAISRLQYDHGNIKIDFVTQALSLAEKLGFKKGIYLANEEMGSVYQRNNDYKTAISYYQKTIDLSEADGYNPENIDFYPALLNLYFYLGDYPNAMETISREMIIAEKTKDKRKIAHCNNILG